MVAQGDLEPAGAVKPIKAVQSAVVEEIFVKEGQVVEPGQPLIRFDTDKSQAQKSNVSRQLLIEQQRISEQANASRARLENLQAKRQSLISKRDSEKLSLVNQEDILVLSVPGALEIPFALAKLAATGDFDALIALGAVVRGETFHFEIHQKHP